MEMGLFLPLFLDLHRLGHFGLPASGAAGGGRADTPGGGGGGGGWGWSPISISSSISLISRSASVSKDSLNFLLLQNKYSHNNCYIA